MRVGVKREFPQRRKKKYRPSSVTSVRTGDSFPRGGSQEVVRPVPILRAALPASPARGGCREAAVGFSDGQEAPKEPFVGHGLPAVPKLCPPLRRGCRIAAGEAVPFASSGLRPPSRSGKAFCALRRTARPGGRALQDAAPRPAQTALAFPHGGRHCALRRTVRPEAEPHKRYT